ncbi:zinc transport system substrate-binding protein [Halovenus aranensis]|jgi:zinc transport system substrate-binding protein|uniref:Zinc transport system substrate-binding protein n=1 Tax=Halovenus aranensis TaxID=890420 RepID=A0A1G8YC77_9EURY|nr:metal ABC transporter substrate-binding protein [Halovenus aranensis]SDK00273.1 zinc transport system substrate-binding protein [Halovenus aranensis]
MKHNSIDERWSPTLSRRQLVAAAGGAVAGSLAGCVGDDDGDGRVAADDGATVVASFFTFYDFGRKVADGTPVTVENLVPTGLHGHGWDPDPSITRRIIDADAFITVGPGFQPWADRALRTVRDDDAGTSEINAREDIDLLGLAASLDPEEEGVGDSQGKDPHFWLDPHRAKAAVDNIVEGLVAVAPEHESTLRSNAEDVRAELDDIDDEWAEIFDSADRDVVFLAAHNAFQYVGERYGATIQPLVANLAAGNDVPPKARQRAQETIADYDIEYIGAAVFEPRQPARQLRDETDVTAYYPVTPYAGTTEEWVERGWGYVEIARNINMPTFEIVLGVDEPSTEFAENWRNFD